MSRARMEAREAGDARYTAERPCFRGHAPIRYTSSGVCVECLRLRQSTKVSRVGPAAPPVTPGVVTLQLDVPALDVRYLQVCAALLAHPKEARLLRAFLERNEGDVRAPLPGVVLKRL